MDISILYTYTFLHNFKGICINQEKEIRLSNSEYVSGHKERINMVARCVVRIHITAKLKAYRLLVILKLSPYVLTAERLNIPCLPAEFEQSVNKL